MAMQAREERKFFFVSLALPGVSFSASPLKIAASLRKKTLWHPGYCKIRRAPGFLSFLTKRVEICRITKLIFCQDTSTVSKSLNSFEFSFIT